MRGWGAAVENSLKSWCLRRWKWLSEERTYLGARVPLPDGLWHVLRRSVFHILPLQAAAFFYPISWDGLSTEVITTHVAVLLKMHWKRSSWYIWIDWPCLKRKEKKCCMCLRIVSYIAFSKRHVVSLRWWPSVPDTRHEHSLIQPRFLCKWLLMMQTSIFLNVLVRLKGKNLVHNVKMFSSIISIQPFLFLYFLLFFFFLFCSLQSTRYTS